jgi:hypothetical protein
MEYSKVTLSPLLFCLALILLTNMLIKQRVGYEVKEKHKVSHLFYMDDLKLFSKLQQPLSKHLLMTYDWSLAKIKAQQQFSSMAS